MLKLHRPTLIFFLLLGLLVNFSPGYAQEAEELVIITPIVETLSLVQSGTLTTPYIANVSSDFDFVTKMNWIIVFADAQMDWTSFGSGSALTNGIYIKYGSTSLNGNQNLTNNYELMTLAFNAHYFQDDIAPKDNIIWIQHLLTSFSPEGIDHRGKDKIQIYIQDDLT